MRGLTTTTLSLVPTNNEEWWNPCHNSMGSFVVRFFWEKEVIELDELGLFFEFVACFFPSRCCKILLKSSLVSILNSWSQTLHFDTFFPCFEVIMNVFGYSLNEKVQKLMNEYHPGFPAGTEGQLHHQYHHFVHLVLQDHFFRGFWRWFWHANRASTTIKTFLLGYAEVWMIGQNLAGTTITLSY